MSEPTGRENEDAERGAAEENSGIPATEMEREVSKPPEERWPEHGGRSESAG